MVKLTDEELYKVRDILLSRRIISFFRLIVQPLLHPRIEETESQHLMQDATASNKSLYRERKYVPASCARHLLLLRVNGGAHSDLNDIYRKQSTEALERERGALHIHKSFIFPPSVFATKYNYPPRGYIFCSTPPWHCVSTS